MLIEALWEAGAKVRAYDPVAMKEAQRIYGERGATSCWHEARDEALRRRRRARDRHRVAGIPQPRLRHDQDSAQARR